MEALPHMAIQDPGDRLCSPGYSAFSVAEMQGDAENVLAGTHGSSLEVALITSSPHDLTSVRELGEQVSHSQKDRRAGHGGGPASSPTILCFMTEDPRTGGA